MRSLQVLIAWGAWHSRPCVRGQRHQQQMRRCDDAVRSCAMCNCAWDKSRAFKTITCTCGSSPPSRLSIVMRLLSSSYACCTVVLSFCRKGNSGDEPLSSSQVCARRRQPSPPAWQDPIPAGTTPPTHLLPRSLAPRDSRRPFASGTPFQGRSPAAAGFDSPRQGPCCFHPAVAGREAAAGFDSPRQGPCCFHPAAAVREALLFLLRLPPPPPPTQSS